MILLYLLWTLKSERGNYKAKKKKRLKNQTNLIDVEKIFDRHGCMGNSLTTKPNQLPEHRLLQI